MKNEISFKRKYPVPLADAAVFPFIYKFWNTNEDLPDVKLKCIINFCEYAGYSEGATRTTISRMKKNGLFISTGNIQKAEYKASDLFKMRTVQIRDETIPKGFTLAVFSFSRENEKERYVMRSVLTKTGFRKLAQNTYISVRGREKELMLKVRKEGLEKHIFLFDCDENLNDNTIQRLTEVWEVKERIKLLNRFLKDLDGFFMPGDLSDEHLFHMLGYAGTVYFSLFQRTEPPVPEKYLPAEYPMKKILGFIVQKNREFLPDTMNYFKMINE